MALTHSPQNFLNTLLLTNRTVLNFLQQAVFSSQNQETEPERIVQLLTEHVQANGGSTPSGLIRWLNSPSSMSAQVLAAALRFSSYYRDANLREPIFTVLRQLTYVAAHPAAVEALARVDGANASRTLTSLLWAAPVHQWHVREPAILRELGRLGDKNSISDLLKALGVPYDTPMRAAAEAIARFEAEDVLSSLLSTLQGGSGEHSVTGAAEALGRLGDTRAIPQLQNAAQSKNTRIAIHASVALARLKAPGAEHRLIALGRSNDVTSRARALSALALLDVLRDDSAHAAFNVIIAGLRDSQPEVRSAAAFALGQLKHVASTTEICRVVGSEVSPLVRSALVRALGQIAQPSSLPTLLGLLKRDSTSVKIEVLDALSMFHSPEIAQYIVPYRQSPEPRLVEAAKRALRRLLHKPFAWPEPTQLDGASDIALYSLSGARERLLPPPAPIPEPGFFRRLFGAKAPDPPPPPTPVGTLHSSPEALSIHIDSNQGEQSWASGSIDWRRPFSLQITREPIQTGQREEGGDIGVHFRLRQRVGEIGAEFQSVAFSLWCAPSQEVADLPAKSERFACLDPHSAQPVLGALRWYAQVHGVPLPIRRT